METFGQTNFIGEYNNQKVIYFIHTKRQPCQYRNIINLSKILRDIKLPSYIFLR